MNSFRTSLRVVFCTGLRSVLGLSVLISTVGFSAIKDRETTVQTEDSSAQSAQSAQSEWTCPGMKMGAQGKGARNWTKLQEMQHVTVDGRIEDVNIHEVCFGEARGLHLKLKSGDDTVFVHVGPVSFVNSKNFPFAIGDDIRVEGALSSGADVKSIFAYTIEKGGKKLILRDADGRPRWSRGRGVGMGRLSH